MNHRNKHRLSQYGWAVDGGPGANLHKHVFRVTGHDTQRSAKSYQYRGGAHFTKKGGFCVPRVLGPFWQGGFESEQNNTSGVRGFCTELGEAFLDMGAVDS